MTIKNAAFRDYIIPVEWRHWAGATRGNPNSCGVSTAIEDAVPEATYVTTNKQYIRFVLKDAGVSLRWNTPRELWKMIQEWDAGGAAPAGEYVLKLKWSNAREIKPLPTPEEKAVRRAGQRAATLKYEMKKAAETPEQAEERKVRSAQRLKERRLGKHGAI